MDLGLPKWTSKVKQDPRPENSREMRKEDAKIEERKVIELVFKARERFEKTVGIKWLVLKQSDVR